MTTDSPDLYNLFMDALEMDSPEQRAAFLDRSCGEDQGLRVKIEQMLSEHRQLGSFLVDPPTQLVGKQGVLTSLEAGMAINAERSDMAGGGQQAVVLNSANHSVLRSLGHTVDVPRVSLREPGTEETRAHHATQISRNTSDRVRRPVPAARLDCPRRYGSHHQGPRHGLGTGPGH